MSKTKNTGAVVSVTRSNRSRDSAASPTAHETRSLDAQSVEHLSGLPESGVVVSDAPSTVLAHLLKDGASTQRRNTLEGLRQACEYEARQPAPDFSYSGIARTVQKLGHTRPKQQTIFNDAGLKQLIDAYRAKHAPSTRQDDREMLGHIPDPHTRHEVKLLLARVAQLERVNNILHENFQKLELGAVVDTVTRPTLPSAAPEELRGQRRAVREFANNLRRFGFHWHEVTGALIQVLQGGAEREVGPPHLRQALEAFVGERLPD